MARKKQQRRTSSGAKGPRLCDFPGCGRPRYAGGLCQSHHRQKVRGEALRPIRHYRSRTAGTVKFAGIRMSPEAAEMIDDWARQKGLSLGGAISDLLESWLRHGATPPKGRGQRRKRDGTPSDS